MKVFTGLLALGFALTMGVGTAEAAKGKKKDKGGVEEVFKKIDTNGDGKIDKDEFAKAADTLGKKKGKKAKKHTADELFAKIDTDKDGSISLDEFKKFREGHGKKRGKKNNA